MRYEIVKTEVFERTLKTALKKYPKSLKAIRKKIQEDILKNLLGGKTTLFSPYDMRKARLGLKAYNIGKRKGLRFFYLVDEEKKKTVPVFIYKKGKIKEEKYVTGRVKENIESILDEIQEIE